VGKAGLCLGLLKSQIMAAKARSDKIEKQSTFLLSPSTFQLSSH
jgi:hypothetical protein